MGAFNPDFSSLAATQRMKHRTTVNESMAGNIGPGRKKILALVPLQDAGSLTNADKITGMTMANAYAYFGHIGYLMLDVLFKRHATADLDVIAVAEAGAGAAAEWSITFATAADMDGGAKVKLGDYTVEFEIVDEDTDEEIATACAAAITADTYAPFSAAAVAAVVTLTYDYKGTLGNDVVVECWMPTGIATTATIAVPGSGVLELGATDPTIDATYTALYKMADYDIVLPTFVRSDDDVEHLETIAAFMRHGEQGRGALHICAYRDSYADCLTWAGSRNKKDFTVIMMDEALPWLTPPHHRAAGEAGIVAAEQNPSVPFQEEARAWVLQGASFALPTSYDATVELALAHGLSIDDIDGNTGETLLTRLISTQTRLSSGMESDVYQSVHVFFTEKFIRQAIVAHLTNTYSTRASKRKVDGKAGDVTSQVVSVLTLYAKPPYEYLSYESLLNNLGNIVVQWSPSNSKRLEIGVPDPVIPEYLGADTDLFIIRP